MMGQGIWHPVPTRKQCLDQRQLNAAYPNSRHRVNINVPCYGVLKLTRASRLVWAQSTLLRLLMGLKPTQQRAHPAECKNKNKKERAAAGGSPIIFPSMPECPPFSDVRTAKPAQLRQRSGTHLNWWQCQCSWV